jgi:hypothetical protein
MQGPGLPDRGDWTIVPLAGEGALLLGQTACSTTVFRCLPTGAAYRLSSSDSAWTPAAPMREVRARPAVVRLRDGRVLVAGGFGDTCTTTVARGYSCAALVSTEIYDPATGVWSPAAPLPEPRGGASATLLSDESVLLVGGSSHTNAALRYDPTSGRWKALAPSPSGLTGSRLLALRGDRAIALGSEPDAGFFGSYGGAGKRLSRICESVPEVYSAARDTWSDAPPLPFEPIACSTDGVLLRGGQVLYSHGVGTDVLDIRQRCWTPAGVHVAQHVGYLATLPDGRALDLGGTFQEGRPFVGAEIYTPGLQHCPASATIKTKIFSQLLPQPNTASLAGLLLESGYTHAYRGLGAGRLEVNWYLDKYRELLGAGEAKSPHAGPLKLTIRLTASGRQTLELAGRAEVTARGTFIPLHGRTVTTTRVIWLG